MRKIMTLAAWGLISVLLQAGFLYYLERQIKGDAVAGSNPKPVIIQKTITLPQTGVKNLQASFAKDYLAYTDRGGLKVFNVKTSKSVFSENKPPQGEILSYHWLPDRNTLLFVTAKPNPDPKFSAQKKAELQQENLNTPKNLAKEDPKAKASNIAPAPAYNPQLTELYAIDFGDPEEDATPDRRLARKLDTFPAGAAIESMDVSTYTNLIYLQVKNSTGQMIYEIDVMKNIRTVNRPGEKIIRMSASDKKGTLYLQSVVSGIAQIVAVKHNAREQLLKGSQYLLLGQEDNKVLVGELKNNTLVKVLSIADTGSQEKISVKTVAEWTGSIPWKNYSVIAATGDFAVIYDDWSAIVLEQGIQRSVSFSGNLNYLTSDGREVMEVTNGPNGTVRIEFKPL